MSRLRKTIIVGGYHDGKEIEAEWVTNDVIQLPIQDIPTSIEIREIPVSRLRTAKYRMVLGPLGYPSLDDEGVYRHEYTGLH